MEFEHVECYVAIFATSSANNQMIDIIELFFGNDLDGNVPFETVVICSGCRNIKRMNKSSVLCM